MTSQLPRAPGRRNHRSEILREGIFAIASFRARQPAVSDLEISVRLAAYTDDHQIVAPVWRSSTSATPAFAEGVMIGSPMLGRAHGGPRCFEGTLPTHEPPQESTRRRRAVVGQRGPSVDLRHLTAAGQSEADHEACVITQPGSEWKEDVTNTMTRMLTSPSLPPPTAKAARTRREPET